MAIRQLHEKYALNAIEVINRFGNAPLNQLSPDNQRDLIGVYYNRLNGVPLEQVPEDKVFSVAERLYDQSHKIVGDLTEIEREILEKMNMFRDLRNPLKRESLDERICIQLEPFPEESYLIRVYDGMRSHGAQA